MNELELLKNEIDKYYEKYDPFSYFKISLLRMSLYNEKILFHYLIY